jgi:hypothetical protein
MTTTGCRQRLNLGARFGDAPLASCLPQDINQAEVRAKLASNDVPVEAIKTGFHALEMKPRVVQLKFDACPKIAVRH